MRGYHHSNWKEQGYIPSAWTSYSATPASCLQKLSSLIILTQKEKKLWVRNFEKALFYEEEKNIQNQQLEKFLCT